MVVFIREVFLVVSEEGVQLDALLEVFDGFCASDLLQEIEVSVHVDASSNQSVPVHTLQLDVGVILLELEVDRLVEVDVWSLDGVEVLASHLKLIEIKILREDLHIEYLIIIYIDCFI